MDDIKPWYLSRTVWASVATVATAAGGLFGLPFTDLDNSALTDTMLQIATAVAGVVALWGRLSARSRIG